MDSAPLANMWRRGWDQDATALTHAPALRRRMSIAGLRVGMFPLLARRLQPGAPPPGHQTTGVVPMVAISGRRRLRLEGRTGPSQAIPPAPRLGTRRLLPPSEGASSPTGIADCAFSTDYSFCDCATS